MVMPPIPADPVLAKRLEGWMRVRYAAWLGIGTGQGLATRGMLELSLDTAGCRLLWMPVCALPRGGCGHGDGVRRRIGE